MNIVKAWPPNIEQIRAKITLKRRIVFTYGNTLYNPHDGKITKSILAHEETHARQQGESPAEWWTKYLADDKFRLSQELEAYQAQLKHYAGINKSWMPYLNTIADHLSSFRYGNIIDLPTAKREIMKAIL